MLEALTTYVIIQDLILLLVLLTVGRKENHILAIFCFLTLLQEVFYYISYVGDDYWKNYPSMLFFMETIGFAKIPILLLYFSYLNDRPLPKWYKYTWSLPAIQFVLFFVIHLTRPFLSSEDYYRGTFYPVCLVFLIFIRVATVVYQLRVNRKILRESSSAISQYHQIVLYWSQWFLVFYLVRSQLPLLFSFFLMSPLATGQAFIEEIVIIYSYIVMIFQAFFVTLLVYVAIRKNTVLTADNEKIKLDQNLLEIVSPLRKTAVPVMKLDRETEEKYVRTISEVVEEQRVYLDPEITLKKLSDLTEISEKQLSLIINRKFGKSFKEYINFYRVEYAKKILSDKEKNDMIIFAVAMESGFNSESVFYAVFKRLTGVTAGQYRQEQARIG